MTELLQWEIVVPVGTVLTLLGLGVYYSLTGKSGSVDVDGDGDPEVSATDGDVNIDIEDEVDDAVDAVVETSSDENDDAEANDDYTDTSEDPVPEKDDLTDVKGIGPTRKASFVAADYETPTDLYYASDDNLLNVDGIGERSLGMIREDIGTIDDSDSDSSSEEDEEIGSVDEDAEKELAELEVEVKNE